MKHVHSLPAALTAIALALAAGSADAQIVNGNFSNGLNGWTTGGDAAAVGGNHLSLTNAFSDGSDDADGINRNLSGVDPLVAGQPGGLEDAVGLPRNGLDPDTALGITAVEGSVATQTFLAAAGSQLSFQWDLSTMDQSGDPTLADLAFVVVDGKLITLGTDLDATTAIAGGSYAAQTGWADWSITFANGGSHTISFGIADIGDVGVTSALDVTDVNVSAVPETSSLALMAAGLGMLAALQRRRRNV
jgi:MYXO-CTERM domain-containing protein